MDYIGLNIYPTGSVFVDPSVEELKANIEDILVRHVLPAVNKFGKPVVFLEHGISNLDRANTDPASIYCYGCPLPLDNREQQEYMDAFYQAISDHPELK